MSRPLPENLFVGTLDREAKELLQRFRDGEMDREEVQRLIREKLDAAMNAIAATSGEDPNANKLEKK